MIRVLLIDDEPLARLVIREYLDSFPQVEILQECNDGFEGVKAIQQHQPDLIYLDIQMPKINGFEMLELIDQPPAVIFTTAFDEFAIRAFETHAVDYLLKPFSKERFTKSLQKWIDQNGGGKKQASTSEILEEAAMTPSQRERVVIRNAGKIKIIPVQEIRWIEAADDYVKLHTKDGAFLKNKTMGYFEKSLPAEQFVRVHRSNMVQVKEITRLEPYEKETWLAILRSGEKVPVSKTGYAKLKIVLGL